VTAKADPTTGGMVTGGGTYDIGTVTTLVAKANATWRFKRWENANTNATRQITVASNSTYTRCSYTT